MNNVNLIGLQLFVKSRALNASSFHFLGKSSTFYFFRNNFRQNFNIERSRGQNIQCPYFPNRSGFFSSVKIIYSAAMRSLI